MPYLNNLCEDEITERENKKRKGRHPSVFDPNAKRLVVDFDTGELNSFGPAIITDQKRKSDKYFVMPVRREMRSEYSSMVHDPEGRAEQKRMAYEERLDNMSPEDRGLDAYLQSVGAGGTYREITHSESKGVYDGQKAYEMLQMQRAREEEAEARRLGYYHHQHRQRGHMSVDDD